MSTEEEDEIIRQARDPETGYVNPKKAHQARLNKTAAKPRRSFAAFLDSLPEKKRPIRRPVDQQVGPGGFLGKR